MRSGTAPRPLPPPPHHGLPTAHHLPLRRRGACTDLDAAAESGREQVVAAVCCVVAQVRLALVDWPTKRLGTCGFAAAAHLQHANLHHTASLRSREPASMAEIPHAPRSTRPEDLALDPDKAWCRSIATTSGSR